MSFSGSELVDFQEVFVDSLDLLGAGEPGLDSGFSLSATSFAAG